MCEERFARRELAVLALHRANVIDGDGVVRIVSGLARDIDHAHGDDESTRRDLIDSRAALDEVRRGVKVRAGVLVHVDATGVVAIGGHVGLLVDAQRRLAGPRRGGGRERLGQVHDAHQARARSLRANSSASVAEASPPSMRASSASTPPSSSASIVVSVGSPETLSTR